MEVDDEEDQREQRDSETLGYEADQRQMEEENRKNKKKWRKQDGKRKPRYAAADDGSKESLQARYVNKKGGQTKEKHVNVDQTFTEFEEKEYKALMA